MLTGRLKIRHLQLAVALDDHRSVVSAAEHLHVTQPVVTRGLQDLEALLGARLFDRGPRGVSATGVGSAFVGHARAVLAQLASAAEHVHALAEGHEGTVSVGTHLAGSNLLVPEAIDQFKRLHPGAVVTVHEATPDVLVLQLLAGSVDLIVGRLTSTDEHPGIVATPLYTEPIRLVVAAGHPVLALEQPTLADLVAYPWILPVSQTQLRGEIEQLFLRQGIGFPRNRVECTSILTMRSLMLSSPYVAALPQLIAGADPALALLPITLHGVSRIVGVSQRRHSPVAPAHHEFARQLADVAQRMRVTLDSEGVATMDPLDGPQEPARNPDPDS